MVGHASLILDVGAGTGISSRRLASGGARVLALEPNAEMRTAAAAHPRVQYLHAVAESIPLQDALVDLITAFQAFHWFDSHRALPEFHRVLKQSGTLAVVFNERDHSDPFTREYGEIIRHLSNNHPAERRERTIDALLESSLFDDRRHSTYRYVQRLDLNGLIGRARSASYLPSEGQGLQLLIHELSALFRNRVDETGQVALVYRTEVYQARRA